MNYIKCLIHWFVSLFCWLTISPLFYYLAWRWKLVGKKLRIFFLLLSPLFLVLYMILFYQGFIFYIHHQYASRYANREAVERITGVNVPDFTIKKHHKGEISFRGEFTDELLIEFEEIPTSECYHALDSLSALKDSPWSKNGEKYSFSYMWGGGGPLSPDGESDEGTISFSMELEKGKKQAVMSFGEW